MLRASLRDCCILKSGREKVLRAQASNNENTALKTLVEGCGRLIPNQHALCLHPSRIFFLFPKAWCGGQGVGGHQTPSVCVCESFRAAFASGGECRPLSHWLDVPGFNTFVTAAVFGLS